MKEQDIFPRDTPQEKIHDLLLERGEEQILFRQLGEDEEATPDEIFVDIGMARIAVDREQAESARGELCALLGNFPRLNPEQLATFGNGPSYLEAGGTLGSQRTALALFGVGEALGLWQVVTPQKMFGDAIDDDLNRQLMGQGYITIERLA